MRERTNCGEIVESETKSDDVHKDEKSDGKYETKDEKQNKKSRQNLMSSSDIEGEDEETNKNCENEKIPIKKCKKKK